MTVKKDLALVRRTVTAAQNYHKRWNITPEFRDEIVAALQNAHQIAIVTNDAELMKQTHDTVIKLEAMNMLDEQHAAKEKRLDAGQATDITGHVTLAFDDAG